MKVPVLFVIFNRPKLAETTFGAIREYAPEKLYIAADGPRKQYEGEHLICRNTRERILNLIDWNCEVHTLFREENIGCGRGPSEAISWMFEHEEYGIILEDDCLPSMDFFLFCEQLLPLYKEEKNVMQINGFNPSSAQTAGNTYTFSHYPKIWGWATWRRAWQTFDFHMNYWPSYRKGGAYLKDFPLPEALIHRYVWNQYYKELRSEERPRAWDLQWSVALFMNKGLCVVPGVNLIRNTGVGVDATNCIYGNSSEAEIQYGKLEFPLSHPKQVVINKKANAIDSRFYRKEKWNNLKQKIKRMLFS